MSARLLLVCFAGLLLSGCAGLNHLEGHDLTDRTVRVRAAVPRDPVVLGYSWMSTQRARRDFERAVRHVDVAERIARQAAVETAEALGYRTARKGQPADYVLDIRVLDYGLVGTTMFVRLEAFLLDRAGEPVWKESIERRRNVYTSITGPQDVADYLAVLADYTAEQVAYALKKDYRRTREA